MPEAPKPTSRPECVTAMDAKHLEINGLKVKAQTAQDELDALIQLHNRLPIEK